MNKLVLRSVLTSNALSEGSPTKSVPASIVVQFFEGALGILLAALKFRKETTMANCPLCTKYVADDANACLLSEKDDNSTLAHPECVEMLTKLGIDFESFTCIKCIYKCEYAFDPYNTNGDCLALK